MRKILLLAIVSPLLSFSQYTDSVRGFKVDFIKALQGRVSCLLANSNRNSDIIVQNEEKVFLEGVTIKVLPNKKFEEAFILLTNKSGKASLSRSVEEFKLEISCIGYKTKTVSLNKKELNAVIELEKDYKLMDSVIITGNCFSRKRVEIICCTILRCTAKGILIQKEDSAFIQKKVSAFDLFPNPALKASVVTIRLTEPFKGQIQLLNSAGQIIQVFRSETNKNQINIQLNTNSAGVYFVRMISFNSNQSLSQKLIVQ